MTDRLPWCKDAPDGKHKPVVSVGSGLVTCAYCRRLVLLAPDLDAWTAPEDTESDKERTR